jgi:hypothetical protein
MAENAKEEPTMDAPYLSFMNMLAGHFSSLAKKVKIAVIKQMLRLRLKAMKYSLRFRYGRVKRA